VSTCVENLEDLGDDVVTVLQNVAFPEAEHCPTVVFEKGSVVSIALDVTADLSHPILRIVAFTELRASLRPPSPVPEITIAEHDKANSREHDVRPPRQVGHVDAVATSELPEATA
jgi:hypothetical protein